MTFQQLQHLLAVHRTGSFSLAAKEMFVSQSAVSNAISGLEQELGCRIFVRSAHGLSLTPEGTRAADPFGTNRKLPAKSGAYCVPGLPTCIPGLCASNERKSGSPGAELFSG